MRYGIGTLIWIICVWKKSVDNEALVVWPSCDFRCDVTWWDMTWRDMTGHDVTWRGKMWCYMTWPWSDITCHDVTWRGMTWHEVKWRVMTWNDVTWHDVTWRGMTWRDMTWHNVAWHDITWHDNKVLVVWPSLNFRATAYKFTAFLSRNECLGNLENLLNRKMTWIFEVSQTW